MAVQEEPSLDVRALMGEALWDAPAALAVKQQQVI
jgi:hypothetical protein